MPSRGEIGSGLEPVSEKETMTVVSGKLVACLPGESDFRPYAAGVGFIVEAKQKFQLKVAVDTAYLCTYE